MTSEVDNLLKGNVISTADYDTYRKLIGVAQENLNPNVSGIVPLAKQNAFVQAAAEVKTEQPVLPQQEQTPALKNQTVTEEINKEQAQEPVLEPMLENPVAVENTSSLSTLTEPKQEAATVQPEPEKKAPILDLQMPQIPSEVVGMEPEKTNETLFAETQSEKNPELNSNDNKLNDENKTDIDKTIEELRTKLKDEIDRTLDELKKLLNLSNQEKEMSDKPATTIEPKVEEGNTLVNDALEQINSMVIPTTSVNPSVQPQNGGVVTPQIDENLLTQVPTMNL